MLDALRPDHSAVPRPTRPPLAGVRLLASPFVSDEERDALEIAASPGRPLRAGAELVREGGATDQVHLIVDGWACRFKTTREGGRQIVALLVPGDAVNLDSLMFNRSDYGVCTLTPCKVAAIPRDRALALAAAHPGVARSFTWLAMVENAILGQWALCLGRQSAQKRLAHLLCELGVRLAGPDGGAGAFDMPLTQEQLADALGLTAVHVNRTLQLLRGRELVVTGCRTVRLPDVARLRAEAEFDPAYLHLDDEDAPAR